MTYYKFYLIPVLRENLQMDPTLYAFTNEKNLMKKFMEQRNKKCFRCLETESSKEEYELLYHQYPMLVLKEIPLRTKDEESITDYSVVKLIGTKREEDELEKFIDDFAFIYEKYLMINPEKFCKPYQKALRALKYDVMHVWALRQRGVPFAIDRNKEMLKKIQDLKFDELALFYYKFGATLKNPR